MKEQIKAPSNRRLMLGGLIFITGFLVPLIIPLVLQTNWSTGTKSVLSGLLAIGLPEVFMLAAAAVLGKSGFQYFKNKIFSWFKKHGPPDRVSLTRYRVGLILFIIPFGVGLIMPYLLIAKLDFIMNYLLYINIIGDLFIVISLFVLGGDFWEKIQSLFIYNSKAVLIDETK